MEKALGDVSLDRLSETLFGRRIRLAVYLWVLVDSRGAFNQSTAARGVGYGSTAEVAKELERLVALGMLQKFPQTRNRGPQDYGLLEHPYWAIIRSALTALDEEAASASRAPEEGGRRLSSAGRSEAGRLDRRDG